MCTLTPTPRRSVPRLAHGLVEAAQATVEVGRMEVVCFADLSVVAMKVAVQVAAVMVEQVGKAALQAAEEPSARIVPHHPR